MSIYGILSSFTEAMRLYLTLDGGGTKLVAARFDEDFNVISRGRSGGVNTTQNRPEDVVQHIEKCLDQALNGFTALKEVFAVFVGNHELLESALRRRASVEKITYFSESCAGLLAGAGRRTGLLALSGTGSDVFWIGEEDSLSVGGWGPVLGDQGSGTWIGLQAVRAVVREINGWGEKTLLTPIVRRHFGAEEAAWNMVLQVHGGGAPFPIVARVAPLVGEAARAGDRIALSIVEAAGEVMATQMKALVRKIDAPREREITLCGGAWKVHPAMLEAFRASMRRESPDYVVYRPWFEHMAAGPMHLALSRGMGRFEARRLIAWKFPEDIISQEGLT